MTGGEGEEEEEEEEEEEDEDEGEEVEEEEDHFPNVLVPLFFGSKVRRLFRHICLLSLGAKSEKKPRKWISLHPLAVFVSIA